MQQDNFAMLAAYNAWMNDKLLGCAARLDQETLNRDCGAFFKSVLGTFNHLLVADILWLKRIAAHPAGMPTLDPVQALPMPAALDSIIHPDLASFESARQDMDRVIVAFVDALSPELLRSRLDFLDTKGNPHNNRLDYLLQHLFNHQTHHRGQLTTLFSQLGIDVGVTDLLMMIRERDLDAGGDAQL